MNRIEEKMTALKNEGRKAFITYTTAGLPDMEKTKKIMFAQQEAGIDVMELGIPFSLLCERPYRHVLKDTLL